MIRLLCLDIDGTLLNDKKELPKENKEAIQYVLKKGVVVAIASGRSPDALQYLLEELGIGNYTICLNGGMVVCEKPIYQSIMEPNLIDQLLDLVEHYQSQVFLSTKSFNITNKNLTEEMQKLIQNGSLKAEQHICQSFDELRTMAKKYPIIKAAIKEIDEKNFDELKAALKKKDLFHVVKSDTYFVDINSKHCNKGEGVRILAEHLHIPLCDVMCIGDNENDVEMIEIAGIGVAMENAVQEVKEVSDYITASNEACGVAKAIYKFFS